MGLTINTRMYTVCVFSWLDHSFYLFQSFLVFIIGQAKLLTIKDA